MTTYYGHQCTKCGRGWTTKYAGFYVCPGCTRVPRLRQVWLRLKYRLLGKTWGMHRVSFKSIKMVNGSSILMPVANVMSEEQQEAVRNAVRNDPEFLAGVEAGLAAYEGGDEGRPWSEVKKELGIE